MRTGKHCGMEPAGKRSRNCASGHGVEAGKASGVARRRRAQDRDAEAADLLQVAVVDFDIEHGGNNAHAHAMDHEDEDEDIESVVDDNAVPDLPEVRAPVVVFDDTGVDAADDNHVQQPDDADDDAVPINALDVGAHQAEHVPQPQPHVAHQAAINAQAPPAPHLPLGCEHLPRYRGLGSAFSPSKLHDSEEMCPDHLVRILCN